MVTYPTVTWLPQAEAMLGKFLTDKKEFTSLEFKEALRAASPTEDIRQDEVGTFLRAAFSNDRMPHFEADKSNGTHVIYRPTKFSLWDFVKSFFK